MKNFGACIATGSDKGGVVAQKKMMRLSKNLTTPFYEEGNHSEEFGCYQTKQSGKEIGEWRFCDK